MITSAVAIEGSQPDQGGDFLPVEKTQLREIGEHRKDDNLAETGNGDDDARFVFRRLVRFEKLGDLFFDVFDLLFQQGDHPLNALLDRLGSQQLLSIRFGRSQVDQLAASGDQLLQFLLFLVVFGNRSGPDVLSEEGDDPCINAVGFGQDAEASGEIANLTWIDDGHEMTGVGEFSNDESLIRTGGFDDDQTRSRIGQPGDELTQPGRIVRDREWFCFGKNANVERVLGNVDTDKRCNQTVHENIPVLQMRARCDVPSRPALAAVRACFKRPATIPLGDGLGRPRRDRSTAGHRGKACSATLRRLSHSNVHYTICF